MIRMTIATFWVLAVINLFLFQACGGSKSEMSASIKHEKNNVDELLKGKLAYSVPDSMEVGLNYNVTVSITKSLKDSILFLGIKSSDDFHQEEILVSSRIKVFLIDPIANNFEIISLNTEEQTISEKSNSVWKWKVKPLRGGQHTLIIRVTVKLTDSFGESYKDIPVFEKVIYVESSTMYSVSNFFYDYWQWIISTLMIPLIIWRYKIYMERKKGSGTKKKTKKKNNNK